MDFFFIFINPFQYGFFIRNKKMKQSPIERRFGYFVCFYHSNPFVIGNNANNHIVISDFDFPFVNGNIKCRTCLVIISFRFYNRRVIKKANPIAVINKIIAFENFSSEIINGLQNHFIFYSHNCYFLLLITKFISLLAKKAKFSIFFNSLLHKEILFSPFIDMRSI